MKKLWLITFLLWCRLYAAAQEVPSGTEQQLENITERSDEETEDDSYLQQLHYHQQHPLNINTASAEDLQLLKLLTPLQIQHLIQYRQLFQNLISLYELQAVPYWDLTTIRNMLPYITIRNEVRRLRSRFTDGTHQLLLRNTRIVESQKGFDEALPTHFGGDANHLFLRYTYQYKNDLQYGLVGEKDAGEAFLKKGQFKGFDFYSMHIFARNIGMIKAVALGDFTVNLGQGLIQWQTLAFKKSAEPLAVVRQAPTLLPYRSAGEFYFNRGAGITLQKKHWEATVFASRRMLSANLAPDSLQTYFTSFSTSGLHRTPSELEDKNAVKQTAYGGAFKLHFNRFNIGFNAVQTHFSKPLQKHDEPYNLFALHGRVWNNVSTDYNFTYRNVYLFGEAALAKNGGTAIINGLVASLAPQVDVALLYRTIAHDYQAVYGNAFTESSAPNNERGFYMGVTVRPASSWRLNGYADFFKSPWLKFRVNAPSTGQEYVLQLSYQPNKALEVYARLRQERKPLNELTPDSVLHFLDPKLRQNLRFHVSYQRTRFLHFKARCEWLFYNNQGADSETGFLAYAEAGYGGLKKLRLNARLQYFSTGSFNSRIYAYESDVLYSYSIPAFFNHGMRYYFNLQYNVFKKLSVWFRWSQTVYRNTESIGSGLTSIAGNTRSELKCQASYRF